MALPTDSSDPFLREVDENLRRDQLRDAARRYGVWIGIAVVLLLAGAAGWLYWQDRQRQKSEQQSEQLAQIYTDIGAGRLATVPPRLDQLGSEGGDVVRASALFTRAAVALEQNDRPKAIAAYGEVAGDEGLPDPYRNLATIRRTTLEFDTLSPEQVIARVQPFTKPGNPWFGSAGELTAMAYLKQGKRTEAGRLFGAIAADPQAPNSIRSRAVQIAGTLGVDATASMPMNNQ